MKHWLYTDSVSLKCYKNVNDRPGNEVHGMCLEVSFSLIRMDVTQLVVWKVC